MPGEQLSHQLSQARIQVQMLRVLRSPCCVFQGPMPQEARVADAPLAIATYFLRAVTSRKRR